MSMLKRVLRMAGLVLPLFLIQVLCNSNRYSATSYVLLRCEIL